MKYEWYRKEYKAATSVMDGIAQLTVERCTKNHSRYYCELRGLFNHIRLGKTFVCPDSVLLEEAKGIAEKRFEAWVNNGFSTQGVAWCERRYI